MYKRLAFVLLAALMIASVFAVIALAADADFTGALKPGTKGHQNSATGTQSKCSTCHNVATGGGYNAHATHQRTMWLSFKDKANNDGCGKCHGAVSTGYEGDLSYTDTGTVENLRRSVDPLVCASCHGRFKASSATHTASSVTPSSNCTSTCHKPSGTGTADSASVAHTGKTWINPAIINSTTISNICLLCHGADGSTGLNRRVWYQVEDGVWP